MKFFSLYNLNNAIILSLLFLSACQSGRYMSKGADREEFGKILMKHDNLTDHHLGIHIEKLNGRTIYSYDAHKQFVPASNIKIYTLYAALENLPLKMPFIDYVERNDTVYVWGIGDPSFLNPLLPETDMHIDALKKLKGTMVLSNNHMESEVFGPGWAWDDYTYSFQPERTFMPIHENVVSFELLDIEEQKIAAFPNYFQQFLIYYSILSDENFKVKRDKWANAYDFAIGQNAKVGDSIAVPSTYDDYRFGKLMSDILDRTVIIKNIPINNFKKDDIKRVNSVKTEDLLEIMMKESDNHVAEQLMLAIHYVNSDTLSVERAIETTSESMKFLPDDLEWRDGSGLSRYNHTTPANNVALLRKIYDEYGLDFIKKTFPHGGRTGTLKYRFNLKNGHHIYAKSGSLTHHYNLSGFIIDSSGEIYVFSWMNSGVTEKNSELSRNMQAVFEEFLKN